MVDRVRARFSAQVAAVVAVAELCGVAAVGSSVIRTAHRLGSGEPVSASVTRTAASSTVTTADPDVSDHLVSAFPHILGRVAGESETCGEVVECDQIAHLLGGGAAARDLAFVSSFILSSFPCRTARASSGVSTMGSPGFESNTGGG